MLNEISRLRLVAFWFMAVAVIVAGGILTGVTVGPSTAAFLLAMCITPPAIMLVVWRGAPPPTVAEVLYAVNNQPDGRA